MQDSKNQSSMVAEDDLQATDGREVRPPLIPSNFEKILKSEGSYNLRGFYNDLFTRLEAQNEAIRRVEGNCQRYFSSVNNHSKTYISNRQQR